MTDEMDMMGMDDEIEVLDTQEPVDVVQGTIESFLESARVEVVYGEPIENGDTLIIPAAEVLSVLGFGVGSGYGSGEDEEGQQRGQGGGGGGGGGGRVLARPVAAIISSPEGVRVEPIVDVTKLALAALTAGGFMVAMIMRMLNPREALKAMRE